MDVSKLPAFPPLPDKLFENINVNLPGGYIFQPNIISAAAMVFLIFLLILTLGQLRHRLLSWHMKGFFPGIAFGIILILIAEGFLLIGGKTVLTGILGWENAPKPISVALDSGRTKLAGVLGVTNETPETQAKQISPKTIHEDFKNLSEEDQEDAQSLLCTP